MTPVMLPCPWCDPLKMSLIGKPKMMAYGNTSDNITHWYGICVACGAEGPKESTKESALAAWNLRGLRKETT